MTPRMKRGSLRTQLVLGSVLTLTLLLIAFGFFVRTVVATTLIASADRDLERQATMPPHGPPPSPPDDPSGLGGLGFHDSRPGDRPLPPPGMPDGFENDHVGPPPPLNDDRPPNDQNPDRPRRFDPSGTSLNPRDAAGPLDPAGLKQALLGSAVTTTIIKDGASLRILSVPHVQNGVVQEIVQTAYPMDAIQQAIRGVDIALLILIPFALVCAGIGGSLITERVLTRVRQTARAAAQIGANDLSRRLPVLGSDEFSELADTFNALLGRVETAFQEQRRFIADASHELKTPLTVIRGTTSLALSGKDQGVLDRQSTEDIDRATASMSDLVQNLLTLARADAGKLGRECSDLPLIEPLQRAVSFVTPRSGVPIRCVGLDPLCRVSGNGSELTRLFTNLLENAARHTPTDGAITVTLHKARGHVTVTIADTGIGIAPQHLEHLGERFYRVDSARSRDEGGGGTGLGLAICKGIVDAHGGTMTFESVLSAGTTVTVTLPRV